MMCNRCGEREAEIKKMTRSGVKPQCGVCVLSHHVLTLTRSLPEHTEGETLRVLARLLALKIQGEDLTDHIVRIDTSFEFIELVRKIKSDRIYEPGEEFDGKVRGDLGDFAEEGDSAGTSADDVHESTNEGS